MIVTFNGYDYKQCYGNKFIKMGDPVPYFDLHFPSKMAPIPMYQYVNGKMEKFMVPYAVTVEKVADEADKVYKEIKKTDIETWHYVKEKYRQWAIENAQNRLKYMMRAKSKKTDNINVVKSHKWLIVPFMKRFDIAQ